MSELDQVLFHRSPGAALVLSREGQILSLNREARRTLAMDPERLVGRPILSLVVPGDRDRVRQIFLRVLSGQEREWIARCLRGDGATRTHWILALPVADGGRVENIVMFMRDVSEAGGGRPETRQLQALLENLPGQFVAVLDTSGLIRYASRLSRTHFRDDVEVVGTPYESLLEPGEESQLLASRMLLETSEGRDWGGTQWHVRADGTPFPVLTVASPYRDPRGGRILGALVVGRDLSVEHRLRLRAERSERMAAVGRMVTALAPRLKEAVERLEAARHAEEAESPWGSVPHAVEELASLKALADSVERLAGMGWTGRPERLSLPHEVGEVVRSLGREQARWGDEVAWEFPDDLPTVHGDREQIRAMVTALVENALESVPPGGRVSVRVGFSATADGDRVRMTVSDDGPGIPGALIHRVGDAFVSTKDGHAGLGLSLARTVADIHGGALTVESPGPEGGTTVTVELPVDAPGTKVRFRPVPLTLNRPRSVLLVDDEAAVRLSVRRFLERVGYEVREAWSGRSALAQITAGNPPEMILTDLRMADGSGSWLMEQLARDFPDLLRRTMIVTGATEEDELTALTRQTGCSVLRKPIEMPRLLDLLDELASRD
jgi:PAS domain S-box-containing protein